MRLMTPIKGDSMANILYVAFGGLIGAVLRYLVANQMQLNSKSAFPYGTLLINLSGCFAIGVLATLASKEQLSTSLKAWLMPGLLGAFTTFSTFSLETYNLFSSGQYVGALTNLLANNFLGLAAVWVAASLTAALTKG
jgi:CrcB protein